MTLCTPRIPSEGCREPLAQPRSSPRSHAHVQTLHPRPGGPAVPRPPGHEEARLRRRAVERLRGKGAARGEHRAGCPQVRAGPAPRDRYRSTGGGVGPSAVGYEWRHHGSFGQCHPRVTHQCSRDPPLNTCPTGDEVMYILMYRGLLPLCHLQILHCHPVCEQLELLVSSLPSPGL